MRKNSVKTRVVSSNLLVIAVSLLLAVSKANSGLITDAADLGTSTALIDFSEFNGCVSFNQAGCLAGDMPDVGGAVGESVVFSGSSFLFTLEPQLFNDVFGLGANGIWTSGRDGYALTGETTSSGDRPFMEFRFSEGVSGIGGLMNYAVASSAGNPFSDITIEVLDFANAVLESYDINALAPISTTGQTDGGAFRGIQRGSNDIYALRLTGALIVMDDLEFSRSVPEPGSVLLLALGLLGLGWRNRR